MPRVAVLIAASPTPAFYSQVAALVSCLRRLPWSNWEPSVHLYLGGGYDERALRYWSPYLRDVVFHWSTDARFARDGDWAQSDDVFTEAPSDVDVLLAMDADTLPVASLERVLDQVHDAGAIAGVIAHQPFPTREGTVTRATWHDMARGLVRASLDFRYSYTLASMDLPAEARATPFYVNFGVVFFPRSAFQSVGPRYLSIRSQLMNRVYAPDFSGQIALTLAIAEASAPTLALPMRFNFPNDPIADLMYPDELANVTVFHYLRTTHFDRHTVWADAGEYARFLGLRLTGSNRAFQQAVSAMFGQDYPFGFTGSLAKRQA